MTQTTEHVMFDREKTAELRKAYDIAVAGELKQFVFHGHVLSVSYANHLLQYLEGKFK